MVDQPGHRIVLAALVTLLMDALEREDMRRFGNDQLRADLRGLLARVEDELGTESASD
jgi:hypothetical protein